MFSIPNNKLKWQIYFIKKEYHNSEEYYQVILKGEEKDIII